MMTRSSSGSTTARSRRPARHSDGIMSGALWWLVDRDPLDVGDDGGGWTPLDGDGGMMETPEGDVGDGKRTMMMGKGTPATSSRS